jgi:hypothetical protein
MQHRHLLPDEIDLLLDEDGGFGLAPLRAHLDACPPCRARVAEARVVADALDRLGYDTPSFAFADRVMAKVEVFEPWHVAALDTARGLMPESTAGRVVVGAGAGLAVASLSTLGVAAALNAEAVLFAAELAVDRVRVAALESAAAAVSTFAGDQAWSVIQSGGGIAIASVGAAMLGSLALGAVALRALVAARRRG